MNANYTWRILVCFWMAFLLMQTPTTKATWAIVDWLSMVGAFGFLIIAVLNIVIACAEARQ